MKTTQAIAFFFISLLVYSATNYGGIRSPDSEVVFRVGESLASGLSFDVTEELGSWRGFGLARGKNDKLYSIFGPLESIICVPLIKIARLANRTKWYEGVGRLPISHYTNGGLQEYIGNVRPGDPEPHALRFIVSFLNAFVSSLGAAIFFLVASRMTRSIAAAYAASILYAFGTLAWPYAGTFFSEPLATLFVLISFYLLILSDPIFPGEKKRSSPPGLFFSGLALGLATSAHITAVLFAPFFALYGWRLCFGKGKENVQAVRQFYPFLLGLFSILFLLGLYNFSRFGNPLETGRSVGSGSILQSQYSHFASPLRGALGLLFSGGKGLVLYCPAVILGVISWRALHRRQAFLSFVLVGTLILRLLFIASRSDWHGGFSLGPRYLVMMIPFLLFPIVIWVEDQIRKKKALNLGLFVSVALICIAQQLYFCMGEVFSYYHLMKWKYAREGINVFKNDRIYLDWGFSPLFRLLDGRTGPFLLQYIQASSETLWVLGTLVLSGAAIAGFRILARQR